MRLLLFAAGVLLLPLVFVYFAALVLAAWTSVRSWYRRRHHTLRPPTNCRGSDAHP